MNYKLIKAGSILRIKSPTTITHHGASDGILSSPNVIFYINQIKP